MKIIKIEQKPRRTPEEIIEKFKAEGKTEFVILATSENSSGEELVLAGNDLKNADVLWMLMHAVNLLLTGSD